MEFKWYILTARSNFENKAKQLLQEKIVQKNMSEHFGEIVVPEKEESYQTKSGKKAVRKKRIFPGYIYINMVMNSHTQNLVTSSQHISGFVGGSRPQSLPEQQMDEILNKQKDNFKTSNTNSLNVGDKVKVQEGPFATFIGTVEGVISAQKVKVNIMIFGRATPVEIEVSQLLVVD